MVNFYGIINPIKLIVKLKKKKKTKTKTKRRLKSQKSKLFKRKYNVEVTTQNHDYPHEENINNSYKNAPPI